MEFDTALYHEQAKSGARPRSHIAAAVERFEQVLLIFGGNADPMVANCAHRIDSLTLYRETNGRSRL